MLNRRSMLGMGGSGAIAAAAGILGRASQAAEQRYAQAVRGLPRLKITRVQTILTQPDAARLAVVKVETSEPGLYGLGCATFTQRAQAVAVAVDRFLAEFAKDRDPDNIEDPFPPEPNKGYFEQLRRATTVPIAMGELFNNPHEWSDLIVERLIDYIRVHVSQIGGLTPARKLAALAEHFGVKTAWHGPPDVSPVGHAANAHLDLAISNFGIQEMSFLNQATRDVFPGSPTIRNGYMFVNEAPGFGVDIDEELAARFPISESADNWLPLRRSDGSAVRP
jgi:L-alanine-DL-glutamate epimerase-like enolase superfamily enzyme